MGKCLVTIAFGFLLTAGFTFKAIENYYKIGTYDAVQRTKQLLEQKTPVNDESEKSRNKFDAYLTAAGISGAVSLLLSAFSAVKMLSPPMKRREKNYSSKYAKDGARDWEDKVITPDIAKTYK